jgi:glucosamine-6-phosphate deaminase
MNQVQEPTVDPHGKNHDVIARVFEDKQSLRAAAKQASVAIRRAILDRGRTRIIVATGASQLDFLNALTAAKNIDWQRVEMFQ